MKLLTVNQVNYGYKKRTLLKAIEMSILHHEQLVACTEEELMKQYLLDKKLYSIYPLEEDLCALCKMFYGCTGCPLFICGQCCIRSNSAYDLAHKMFEFWRNCSEENQEAMKRYWNSWKNREQELVDVLRQIRRDHILNKAKKPIARGYVDLN